MASISPLSSHRYARRIPTPGDLQGLRRSIAREGQRRKHRKWSLPRMLAMALIMLALAPVAAAVAGVGVPEVQQSAGCRMTSIVDGNTVDLLCPGRVTEHHDVMGLSSPPILGARCLSEAWWGLRSEIALRSRLWRSDSVTFVVEGRARLVLILVDGVPLHRLITPAPRDPCA